MQLHCRLTACLPQRCQSTVMQLSQPALPHGTPICPCAVPLLEQTSGAYKDFFSTATFLGCVPRVAEAASPAYDPGYDPPTLLDLQFIVKFSEDCAPDQLRCLVHSLCPAIHGHELVKARPQMAVGL